MDIEQEGGHIYVQTSGEMESFHAVSFFGANFAFQAGGVSTTVCADFLAHYPTLFNVDREEVRNTLLTFLSYPLFISSLWGEGGSDKFSLIRNRCLISG